MTYSDTMFNLLPHLNAVFKRGSGGLFNSNPPNSKHPADYARGHPSSYYVICIAASSYSPGSARSLYCESIKNGIVELAQWGAT